LCLRSNFIISDENCSGGEAQPQISRSDGLGSRRFQIWRLGSRHSL